MRGTSGLNVFILVSFGALLVASSGGHASETVDSADDSVSHYATAASTLATGDRLAIENGNGSMEFAGHELELVEFDGLVGYSTEIAYVVVIDGRATIDGQTARSGSILLIPPFGEAPRVETFEAKRLLAGSDDLPANLKDGLERIKRQQRLGVFIGRLRRTNFNAAASGLASDELAKRPTIGGVAIRNLRFNLTGAEPGAAEAQVVSAFAHALRIGDADAVAELMDPVAYEREGLGDSAANARQQLAQQIIRSRDWKRELTDASPTFDSAASAWAVPTASGRLLVRLRTTRDFPFVETFTVGAE